MKILIVSDSESELAWLSHAIGQCHLATVLTFNHPAPALDWCLHHEPDLVLVAHLMRATDGLEFIRRYRANPASGEVPVVLMHEAAAAFVRGDALRAGATDFLTQPVDFPELVARMVNLLALRYARRQLNTLRGRNGTAAGAAAGGNGHAGELQFDAPMLHSRALH